VNCGGLPGIEITAAFIEGSFLARYSWLKKICAFYDGSQV
jgi:hypothetical protein